ncbi:sulfotransferase family protein [Roseovarius mucosus]|uniref:sulfotransferase family 2 domain-containing protein n=1 Tax=Roseovarius mucosus TaxID=215743 RepID=UPI001C5F430E|nr:sulfotransferase family 2 domain-containing protein [Roseovarius mucosus]MBW4972261.1 sulfotransferase family protein [Roseovarius mucosus]
MLSSSFNFIFIHVPKTGGNSIQKALLPYSDDRIALIGPHHDGINRFEIRSPEFEIHKHATLEDYRRQLDQERYARLIKVTCVRNPWERCVSYYFSPHRGAVVWSEQDFANFISNTVHPHAHYLTLDGLKSDPFDNVDVILKYETLEMDFKALCGRLGLGDVALPRLNASVRDTYRSYFVRDDVIELVAEKFAPEIDRFGYSF